MRISSSAVLLTLVRGHPARWGGTAPRRSRRAAAPALRRPAAFPKRPRPTAGRPQKLTVPRGWTLGTAEALRPESTERAQIQPRSPVLRRLGHDDGLVAALDRRSLG